MSQPRTYAELRQQWLKRVLPDADLPHMRAETIQQVVQATIDQLQRALHDPERDPDASLASTLAFSVVPTSASQDQVAGHRPAPGA